VTTLFFFNSWKPWNKGLACGSMTRAFYFGILLLAASCGGLAVPPLGFPSSWLGQPHKVAENPPGIRNQPLFRFHQETQSQGVDSELSALRASAEAEANKGMEKVEALKKGGAPILNAFNPRVTVFGDFVYTNAKGPILNDAGNDVSDRASLREAELDFRADIDPIAKGVAILSFAEENPGEYAVEAEEMYVLLPGIAEGLDLKVGRFRPAFGVNNLLHTHDLPWTNRPLVVQEFLGDEGFGETGGEAKYLIPGTGSLPIELRYALVNGESAAVLSGVGSHNQAHLGRVSTFLEVGDASFLQMGTSAMFGESDLKGGESKMFGFDLLYKWRPKEKRALHSLVVQAEGFFLDRELNGNPIKSYGAFATLLWQQNRDLYFGVRGDWTQFADQDSGHAQAGSLWASYYSSEFLRFRLGFEALDDSRKNLDWTAFFQMTFVFGSHPAEPYWVNR
jgi:hypothetical protein